MARRNGARQNGPRGAMRARIAAAAARIMAEEGIDDFALAKRKAAERLGATDIAVLNALGTRDAAEALARAEGWRPWRAYAVMGLWHALENRP